jgi:hypothetical protein
MLFSNFNQIVATNFRASTATFHTTPLSASFGQELQCLPPGRYHRACISHTVGIPDRGTFSRHLKGVGEGSFVCSG